MKTDLSQAEVKVGTELGSATATIQAAPHLGSAEWVHRRKICFRGNYAKVAAARLDESYFPKRKQRGFLCLATLKS